VRLVESVGQAYKEADLIVGCSGVDTAINSHEWLESLTGDKILASCSSEDREFRTLLTQATARRAEPEAPLSDVTLELPNARLVVLRGGFPINFDGTRESVPSHDVQLTRGLLLAGIAQAVLCETSPSPDRGGGKCLDERLQQFVVHEWFSDRPELAARYSRETVVGFSDPTWVYHNSTGRQSSCQRLRLVLQGA
jgi:hypothetical protein